MEKTNIYKVLVENLKGRHFFGDLDVRKNIILKWILNRQAVSVRAVFIRYSGWLL
jgi:hypothetical protein